MLRTEYRTMFRLLYGYNSIPLLGLSPRKPRTELREYQFRITLFLIRPINGVKIAVLKIM